LKEILIRDFYKKWDEQKVCNNAGKRAFEGSRGEFPKGERIQKLLGGEGAGLKKKRKGWGCSLNYGQRGKREKRVKDVLK